MAASGERDGAFIAGAVVDVVGRDRLETTSANPVTAALGVVKRPIFIGI
jgi:hypothetical protein